MAEMRGEHLLAKAKESVSLATNYSWNTTQPDGHWIGELLSNVTLTAEHVFFLQLLGQTPIKDANEYQRYLLSEQKPDGGWGIAPDLPSELSTSAEAYLALKILGLPTDAPEMQRARNFVRASGGIAKVRILSRLFFAQFGLFPWDAVPQLPAEFILMPPQFPLNIYKLASWARSNVVPLLIICHHRPIYPLPNGRLANNTYLDELWLDPSNKMIPYGPSLLQPLKTDPVAYIFNIVDKALYYLNGLRGCPVRGYARRKCIDWILERQEEAGDWAGIAPPMHSGVKALLLEGFTLNDKPVIMGMEALERFMWRDENGKRLQACISPVWDTCLMTRALCDAEVDRSDVRLCRAVEWTKARQILGPQGDWRIYNPHLLPGGFAFEYHNTWYPDVDDTAAVVLGFLRHDLKSAASFSVIRAVTWILGMQNSDGGWGAFDHENDALYLNKIPFSDMNSLCDPSTPDVTGRILEAFGLIRKATQKVLIPVDLMNRIQSSCDRAIPFITQTQVPWGPWYGRWGSNYIYGTSNVLCGLSYYINEYPNVLGMMQNATNWLKKVQNNDGGWGESLHTYTETWRAGNGPSTPSQTGWALMGLLNICSPDDESVISGVSYLIRTQTDFLGDGASWPEKEYTGTGFPNHFYIGYTLYRHYFPLMAMGRFVSLASSQSEKKETTNDLTLA